MRKFSFVLLLIICIMTLTLTLTSCAKSDITDVTYDDFSSEFSRWRFGCHFTINGLPEGEIRLKYTYRLLDVDGNELYCCTNTETVILKEGETSAGINNSYEYISKSDLADSSKVKDLVVDNIEILSTKSSDVDRLKPYAITIGVLAAVGVAVLVTLCAVFEHKRRVNRNEDNAQ